MQFYHPLDAILGQTSKIKLLRFLSQYPGQFTGRELARLTNLSHPIVHKVLEDLEQQGVILMKKSGQAFLYSLNEDNNLNKNLLLPLFKAESELKKQIVQILVKNLDFPIESIILFGSISQQSEKPTSDIDILVVLADNINLKETEAKLLSAGLKIVQEFGNQVSPIVINLSTLIKKLKTKDKLLSEILRQGQIIYGKSLMDLLVYARSKNSNQKRS